MLSLMRTTEITDEQWKHLANPCYRPGGCEDVPEPTIADTIQKHLQNAFEKIGSPSRQELVKQLYLNTIFP